MSIIGKSAWLSATDLYHTVTHINQEVHILFWTVQLFSWLLSVLHVLTISFGKCSYLLRVEKLEEYKFPYSLTMKQFFRVEESLYLQKKHSTHNIQQWSLPHCKTLLQFCGNWRKNFIFWLFSRLSTQIMGIEARQPHEKFWYWSLSFKFKEPKGILFNFVLCCTFVVRLKTQLACLTPTLLLNLK